VLLSLLALAVPMLIGQAGQVLIQLTDTLMLGRVGSVPLAAAAVAGNFMLLALSFAYGALGAVAPSIAQAHGAADARRAADLARAGTILGLAVGCLAAAGISGLALFLDRLGQPPEVVTAARPYLLLVAWSLPAGMAAVAMGQAAEALGQPWPVLGCLLGAVMSNAVLDWVLIFGAGPIPPLGLVGAGWATFVTRWLQAAVLAIWIARGRQLRPFGIFSAVSDRGSGRLRDLLAEGLPVAAQDVLEGGSFAVGSLMIGWAGTQALAAHQVTVGIASLAWVFPIALAGATSVRVAHAAGAGDFLTARRTGLVGVAVGAAVMGACAVVYTTCGTWLARRFTADPEVVSLAATLVTIAGLYQVSDAVQSVSLGALRGLLDNRVPLVVNAICYWGLSIPAVYLLSVVAGWGAIGVWVGYLPWMALAGLVFLARFIAETGRRGRG
jgi:MATE family multidrug resistance protein